MKRILVIGSAGAGKSTFAKRLSEVMGLPLYHLDQLYWRAGWIPNDGFRAEVAQIQSTDSWIIDGNYNGSMAARILRADTVTLLDLGRYRCLWNVFWRTIKSHGEVREDMPAGCPEQFTWEFFKFIWDYPVKYRPVTLKLLDSFAGEVVGLTRFSEYDKFLARLDPVL